MVVGKRSVKDHPRLFRPWRQFVAGLRRLWSGDCVSPQSPSADAATLRLQLLRAVVQGDARALAQWLRAPCADPNGIGASLLLRAVHGGHAEVIKILLAEPRIDVNRSRLDGTTPLMLAVETNRPGLVDLLVSHPRTDVHRARFDGQTALTLALELGQRACVDALLRRRAQGAPARLRLVDSRRP